MVPNARHKVTYPIYVDHSAGTGFIAAHCTRTRTQMAHIDLQTIEHDHQLARFDRLARFARFGRARPIDQQVHVEFEQFEHTVVVSQNARQLDRLLAEQ